MLARHRVGRYLHARVEDHEEHHFRQRLRVRPGPRTRHRLEIRWELDEGAIAFDQRSDGMYPLLTNDCAPSPRDVLDAHKR